MITEDQRDTIGIKNLISVNRQSSNITLYNYNDTYQLYGVKGVLNSDTTIAHKKKSYQMRMVCSFN